MRALMAAISIAVDRVFTVPRCFNQDNRGSFGILTAILLPCVIIAAGCAIDISRLMLARLAAQGIVDSAVLAAASSGRPDSNELKKIVSKFLKGSNSAAPENLTLKGFEYRGSPHTLSATFSGTFDTTFMKLANIDEMPFSVSAEARWSTQQSIEIAMVLDNTWSMNGVKLQALRQAGNKLVDILEKNRDPGGSLRIGLVPYADYVNIGMYNRFRSWVSVPDEYTTERVCETVRTAYNCIRGQAKTCSRTVDGVPRYYDCTPSQCSIVKVSPYERCTGGEEFTWYGCVGSRTSGRLRLTDASPQIPYPGILGKAQNCLNPIVPLTDSLPEIRLNLNRMVVHAGSYMPSTYIPAGLLWGVNVLSPAQPFSEARAYDKENKVPRKVLILMTDGANTMAFDEDTGRHVDTKDKRNLKATYDDMQSICNYAKSMKIDVYTISFLVDDDTGQQAMLACASSPGHSFDAKNAEELDAAFSNIAASLSTVVLTK